MDSYGQTSTALSNYPSVSRSQGPSRTGRARAARRSPAEPSEIKLLSLPRAHSSVRLLEAAFVFVHAGESAHRPGRKNRGDAIAASGII